MFIDSNDNNSPLRRSEISAHRAPTERRFIPAQVSINIWPLRGRRLRYPRSHLTVDLAPRIYSSSRCGLPDLKPCDFVDHSVT
jgi:hypothetical protein